jgi:uncharacterized protein
MDAIKNRTLIPGLSKKDCHLITGILARFPGIHEAIIFGSRAKGKYKNGSDIDVALKGEGINSLIISQIQSILNEELPLPWFFDVVSYEHINDLELKEHINRVGIVFYTQPYPSI